MTGSAPDFSELMQGFPPPPAARITHENWDRPPYNRWAFCNVRQVLPTRVVSRGDGQASLLPRLDQDLDGLGFIGPDGGKRTIGGFLDETFTDGWLVLHRGNVVTERYFAHFGRDALHLSQSVAKSVVGTVAGILIDRGTIDPHAPLVQYVPEFRSCGYADATLAQVLDMRSGVRFDETYTDPNSDVAKLDPIVGWRPNRPDVPNCIYDLILTLPKERAHGGAFQYRSIETDVVGWVCERASGTHLCDLVSTLIWQPMGAELDACFTVDRGGVALADGGLNAALRDYARFGLLYANGGTLAGRPIVPANWVEACRHKGDMSAFAAPYSDLLPGGAYRNQWWVRDPKAGIIMARGVFGQMIYVDPRREMVIVKLSTWPDFTNPDRFLLTLAAVDAIAAALG
jgi:CubicO group peptidase (beta-lactamase class C family)